MTAAIQAPMADAAGQPYLTDPTLLTDKAIAKAVGALTSYIDGKFEVIATRLDGNDTATGLRLAVIEHAPRVMDEKVAAAVALTTERFAGVTQQFAERDIRTEREAALVATARDAAFKAQQEAVAAAFAAQEKQAAAQNKANSEAQAKSEAAIADSISKLTQLFQTSNGALADKVDDLKERLGRVEAVKIGATEQRTEGRQSNAATIATIAFGFTAVLFVVTLVAFALELNKP